MTDYRGLIFDDTREGASNQALAQLEATLAPACRMITGSFSRPATAPPWTTTCWRP
ncbi:hypothetical protein [Pseudomonas cyclaminis]|uniref:hypothetical protein n=1 Tax=Pseudomonas cyclaminis TaxID=2781239 RepID=UPI0019D5E973|nr:hypothetical protein [Pseudomonas cyclaminis]